MHNTKWYLSTWLIAIMFTLWLFIIPGIVGLILLVLQIRENIKIRREWEQSGFGDLIKIQEEIDFKTNKIEELEAKKNSLEKQINGLEKLKAEKQDEIVILDDELLLQSFGFYDPIFEMIYT